LKSSAHIKVKVHSASNPIQGGNGISHVVPPEGEYTTSKYMQKSEKSVTTTGFYHMQPQHKD
jgi:hypothetical protein